MFYRKNALIHAARLSAIGGVHDIKVLDILLLPFRYSHLVTSVSRVIP